MTPLGIGNNYRGWIVACYRSIRLPQKYLENKGTKKSPIYPRKYATDKKRNTNNEDKLYIICESICSNVIRHSK